MFAVDDGETVRGPGLQDDVVHGEHGGRAVHHRQVVGGGIQRHRIAGEVGALDDELVAPRDVRDRLGRVDRQIGNVIDLDDAGVERRRAGVGEVQDHQGVVAGNETADRQVAQFQIATGSHAGDGDGLEDVDREEQRRGR